MERALEEALSEALAKYKEQTEYWMGKQAALEQNLERAKVWYPSTYPLMLRTEFPQDFDKLPSTGWNRATSQRKRGHED